ncbi:50S ribosome-binding GTPase [Wenzhouxiangella sp. AB-CW3]|uniref:YcjF family protein n=1 Tax=Wenzhouxiangella sp. AB-CW3 TaxID=2771012 RepID=UPI00168B9FC9|nr:GTPase [Wenzhouxiangella sp. AB-CW3]QOC22037.1 50S ribosome-binding GTPase [Wenzhouxiangella sp. AB-CW3]
MSDDRGFWTGLRHRLHRALSTPDVDAEQLAKALNKAAEREPAPVVWLLGLAQSGKTSIVRALTGSSRAAIGDGFRACTRTASIYDFPPEVPVVRFLDTRGLGEVGYDPSEDIALCEDQSHLLIVVVRAAETRPQPVLEVLRTVRKRHPDWPVVVAQTCLHHAYDQPANDNQQPGHILPYPYRDDDWQSAVPEGLSRLLLAQREFFANLPGKAPLLWVPLDFTQPEDGFEPAEYGLDALWDAIEQAASLGLEARLRADSGISDLYSRAAHPHIVGFSLAAGTVGALPVVDLALVPALQAGLLHRLAGLYQQRWTARSSAEFLGLLGSGFAAGYGARLAGRSLVKLIPVWGQTAGAVLGATASGAITFALGKAACAYLGRKHEGRSIDATALRQAYRDGLDKGRQLLRQRQNRSGPQ